MCFDDGVKVMVLVMIMDGVGKLDEGDGGG